MKITIKDYQAIRDTEIVIEPGITAIVGPTNSGKSSILRAVQGAINNQSGIGFINYDADESIVTIEDSGNKIEWVKAKRGPAKYIINGEEINKIGRQQNEEVAELLNMEEVDIGGTNFRLNFWNQMDKAFLMDRSPNQLFTFISQSKEQELVQGLDLETRVEQTALASASKEKLIKADVIKQDIENLNKEISNLAPYKEFDLKALENSVQALTKLSALNNLRNQLGASQIDKLKELQEVNNRIAKTTEVITKLDQIVKELNETIAQKEELLTRTETCSLARIEINHTKQRLETTNKTITLQEEIITQLDNTIKELQVLEKQEREVRLKIGELNRCKANIVMRQGTLKALKDLITDQEQELSLIEVCPFCGSEINKDHKH